MAKKGQAGPALAISAIGLLIRGTLSVVVLTVLACPIAPAMLRFGPAENFVLMIFALILSATLIG